jgi:alpha-ketoglutarate-dependent taurine dioxygenase
VLKKLPTVRRKAVGLTTAELVRAETLRAGEPLPLVIEPRVEGLEAAAWAESNREFLEGRLPQHGAILFRGWRISTVAEFERLVGAAGGGALPYRERSSPRSRVGENVYTSTDYPADQSIFPHNEHSYARTFPLKLLFCCLTPAEVGGETPVADTRRIYRRISPDVRAKFAERRWMYVRNFGEGFGLPWQTVFQTADRAVVEDYCRRSDIACEWKSGDRLTTRQVRPAAARHPLTGEAVWFNHATFFHVSTLPAGVRDGLLAAFAEEDLPNNTYYGDGTPIEPDVLEHLRDAYRGELVSFAWQRGDVLLLDNMLTAHSRAPFEGPRRVLFAMAEPYTRDDV